MIKITLMHWDLERCLFESGFCVDILKDTKFPVLFLSWTFYYLKSPLWEKLFQS